MEPGSALAVRRKRTETESDCEQYIKTTPKKGNRRRETTFPGCLRSRAANSLALLAFLTEHHGPSLAEIAFRHNGIPALCSRQGRALPLRHPPDGNFAHRKHLLLQRDRHIHLCRPAVARGAHEQNQKRVQRHTRAAA